MLFIFKIFFALSRSAVTYSKWKKRRKSRRKRFRDWLRKQWTKTGKDGSLLFWRTIHMPKGSEYICSLSLLFSFLADNRDCSFSSQLSSFGSFVLPFYSRSRSAFSAILYMPPAARLQLRTTVKLWITCPCSRPLS